MKAILLMILFAVGFSALASAEPFNASTFLDNAFNENGTLVGEAQAQLSFASQQFQELPSPVKAIFGNQRVAVDFTRADGTVEHLGVVLTNNMITSFTRFPPANPTMTVQTDEATAARIATSGNFSEAFVQAVNSGDLSYEATEGGGGEFAVFMANILVWISTVINALVHAIGL